MRDTIIHCFKVKQDRGGGMIGVGIDVVVNGVGKVDDGMIC